MTQNLHLLLQNFFTKHPDIRESRNRGLVNRRALAKYIIEKEKLNINRYEALVTALRRYPAEPFVDDSLKIVNNMNIATKEKITIIYLKKTTEVLQNVLKISKFIDFNKNETLKLVQGSLSFKIFVDEHNLIKVKELFSKSDILRIQKNISEMTLVFTKDAPTIRGIISFVTSQLTINKVNITEMITGDPELMIYLHEDDLLQAYETIKRLTR